MIAYAMLKPDSPRRAEWLAAFGTDRVRLRSPRSQLAILPGIDGPCRCYRAAVYALARAQREGLRRYLDDRYFAGKPAGAIKVFDGEHGLPILDGPDLVVTVEADCYL